jgi:transcriptional regulator with XRE-family HTH domain
MGVTQEQLAAQTGYSSSHVKRIERGEANPSPACRAAFAAALDVDVQELFADFTPARQERERARADTRQGAIKAMLVAGATQTEVAAAVGCSQSTVSRDAAGLGLETRPAHTRPKYERTERLCLRCGKPLEYEHPSDRANRTGLYHRECYEAGAVVNTCPVCGKKRRRKASDAHKLCCSYRCSNRYRWRVSRKGLEVLIARMGGPARRDWLRRLRAREVGKLGGPKPRYTPEQAEAVLRIKAKYPTWGLVRISQVLRPLTPKQVRGILERAPG